MLHQIDLLYICNICIYNIYIYIYKTYHPKVAEYTFFSRAHGILSRIYHKLNPKTSLKFKKIEIISSTFFNHNGIRLEINHKKNTTKNTNSWRLSNVLLNNQWVTEEIKGKFKKYLGKNENGKTMLQKPVEYRKSSSKKKVYRDTSLPQEKEKFKINNLTLHLKELEKEQIKPKSSRRKEIINIRAEINKIKNKMKMKLRAGSLKR